MSGLTCQQIVFVTKLCAERATLRSPDLEMNLHVKLCAGWGLLPSDLEQTLPAVEMLAYRG